MFGRGQFGCLGFREPTSRLAGGYIITIIFRRRWGPPASRPIRHVRVINLATDAWEPCPLRQLVLWELRIASGRSRPSFRRQTFRRHCVEGHLKPGEASWIAFMTCCHFGNKWSIFLEDKPDWTLLCECRLLRGGAPGVGKAFRISGFPSGIGFWKKSPNLSNGGVHVVFSSDGARRFGLSHAFPSCTAVTPGDVRDGCLPDSGKIAMKLRVNWGRASARRLKRVLADSAEATCIC